MTTGALLFAHNNSSIDYVKLAIYSATKIKEYLDIPVSLATDNKQWVLATYPDHPFDQIIETNKEDSTSRSFYDGTLSSKKLDWKNLSRNQSYNITPYDTTIVIDSDYILNSSILKDALTRDVDFQIYQKSFDLAGWRDTKPYERINQYSIRFYWATVFVFRKTAVTRALFDLIAYIKTNWMYFRILYNVESSMFRNDYAFSIAIHLMNGKTDGHFITELPGTMTYIIDKDVLVDAVGDKMQFLVEKENRLGEYTLAKTTGIDVHVMNKMSLLRFIDGGSGV